MLKYREIQGVSRSQLVNLIDGPFYFESPEDAEYFTLGTLTEKLYNEVTHDYKVVTFPPKTTNLGKMINAVWQNGLDMGKLPDVATRQLLYSSLGIKSPKFEELDAQVGDFFLQAGFPDPQKDIIVSEELMNKAEKMATKLREDKYVNELFSPEGRRDVEILTSFPITWEFEGLTCKAEIDKLIIDHGMKTIRVVDLKTTGKVNYKFKGSFFVFRYDIQAAFYDYGIRAFLKDNPHYKGYAFLYPIFIAVDPYTPKPLIFEVENITLVGGENGFTDIYGNSQPGWRTLLQDYLFYEQHGYEYPRTYVENNGLIKI